MAITYDAPSNTITVTGYTELAPCTFEDILRENDAQGWDVVDSTDGIQFLFACKLIIGDGTTPTVFTDASKQITIADGIPASNFETFISLSNNTVFTDGILGDENAKYTRSGCDYIDLQTTYRLKIIIAEDDAEAYLYSSSFTATGLKGQTVGGFFDRIWNVAFKKGVCMESPKNTNIYNTYVSNAYDTIGSAQDCTIDKLTGYGCDYGFWVSGSTSLTVSNSVFRALGVCVQRSVDLVSDSYLIDCEADSWVFSWVGTCTAKIYRQYTINLLVKDSVGDPLVGVTATLTDKADGEVFSVPTGGAGTIAEQTVSRGYYDQTNGDTLQDYGPFVLTLTKEGYKPLTIEDIVLADPVDWTLELLKWSEVLTDKVDMTVEISDQQLTVEIADQTLDVEIEE